MISRILTQNTNNVKQQPSIGDKIQNPLQEISVASYQD